MIRPVLLEIMFSLRCEIKRDEAARVIVSRCPALDVYSQGRNKEEAKDALLSAVRLFIAASYDQGTLEHTLKSQGFTAAQQVLASTEAADKEFIALKEGLVEEFDLNVPLSLISQEPPACPR